MPSTILSLITHEHLGCACDPALPVREASEIWEALLVWLDSAPRCSRDDGPCVANGDGCLTHCRWRTFTASWLGSMCWHAPSGCRRGGPRSRPSQSRGKPTRLAGPRPTRARCLCPILATAAAAVTHPQIRAAGRRSVLKSSNLIHFRLSRPNCAVVRVS